jgi:hypothetical protein
MEATTTDWLQIGIGVFCFGYPFVMAWYWMVGGLLFYITRERHMAVRRQLTWPVVLPHRRMLPRCLIGDATGTLLTPCVG